MNIFAGNITLKGNKKISDNFEYDYIESFSKSGNKNLYIFGETKFNSSKEMFSFLKEQFGEILNYDISISIEDKIKIFPYDYEEGIYELVSFEGEEVSFEEILHRFENHDAIFSLREAEESKRFGNKIIKVEFVY